MCCAAVVAAVPVTNAEAPSVPSDSAPKIAWLSSIWSCRGYIDDGIDVDEPVECRRHDEGIGTAGAVSVSAPRAPSSGCRRIADERVVEHGADQILDARVRSPCAHCEALSQVRLTNTAP